MAKREDLIFAMEKTFRTLIRSHRKSIGVLLGRELTGSEFMCLKYLQECGPSKVSDLAEDFQVNISHVTSLSDKLVSRNLISRVRSNSDRRIVELQLTDEGFVTFEKARKKRNAYFKGRFSELNDDEIKQMNSLLSKLK